jgi:molybdate transport system substrate-binding protein
MLISLSSGLNDLPYNQIMRPAIKAFTSILVATMGLSVAPLQPAYSAPNIPATLIVFAASSLTGSFTEFGEQFQKSHPGTTIRLSFLSSSTLATQINSGAPADVFASASELDMAKVGDRVPLSHIFARNHVVLAFLQTNPLHITGIQDLKSSRVKWVQCAHQVPCGIAADAALAAEGIREPKPVSLESKVSSAVAKLVLGEVDAAIIYHSDVVAHRSILREILFKNLKAATTAYPIGVVKTSSHIALARTFVAFVLSPTSSNLLTQAGFGRAK